MPALEGKSMPANTQMVATAPLDEALARRILPTDRAVEDCNYLLDYYRLSSDPLGRAPDCRGYFGAG